MLHKPGNYFMLGNVALAEGAYAAGCNFVAGYPITPASEILEHLSKLFLGHQDKKYIQFEDEIASMASLVGASWAGAKGMTATSGPGFSLMQENLGLAFMTESPCVVVDIQRSGPSTGQATKPGQGDFYQTQYGSHGDYMGVVLAPWSVQEMYDLAVTAFNYAELLRTPVVILADGEVAHLEENIVLPDPDSVVLAKRKRPDYLSIPPEEVEPFAWTEDLVPPMPLLGDGANVLVTGSTHRPSGLRDASEQTHINLVNRLHDKILSRRRDLWLTDEYFVEDAQEGLFIAYGIAARQTMEAVRYLRKQGKKVGLLRLKTLWPFPDEVIQERCTKHEVSRVFVTEMSRGKLVREVERSLYKSNVEEVIPVLKIGGDLHKVKEIVAMFNKEDA